MRPEKSMAYIGRYGILSLIARDARGIRYHAYDMEHQQDVSLLVMAPASGADSADLVANLFRWQAATRLLNHPRITRAIAVESIDNLVLVAYQYAAVTTLADAFGQSGMSFDLDTALSVGEQIAGALEYMHASGVYHFGLAPHNVILTQAGQVLLTDIALDRFLTAAGTAPHVLAPGGSPLHALVDDGTSYVAPEVLEGRPAGEAADVYSLGALLYRMITGVAPAEGAQGRAVNRAPVSAPVLRVLSRALSAHPEQRFAGPMALIRALDRAARRPAFEAFAAVPALPAGVGRLGRGWLMAISVGLLFVSTAGWFGWNALTPRQNTGVAALASVTPAATPEPATAPPATASALPAGATALPPGTSTPKPALPSATPGGTDTPAQTQRPVTPSATPTRVPTRTPVPSSTPSSATVTAEPSATLMPTAGPSNTQAPAPTRTRPAPTSTYTSPPPTNTPPLPPTNTPLPPTNTAPPPPPTNTPVPPTSTWTPPPATDTAPPPPPTDTPAPPPTNTPPPPPP